ncbi:DUF4230 domain-containing protein [Leptolyngbya sp. CCNP1308]|uniref:DUF4230 domain-containing protein n=1 Tax=Leptolyngbya sp. CCNP1308 TaxID=3110255 RepID=UPI002B21319C|nr:DUF4230 domain-containing protein [Leptolyngbya sp. CCNP1308]
MALPQLVNSHFNIDTREILVAAISERVEAPTAKEDYEFDVPAQIVSYVSGEKVGDVLVGYKAVGSVTAQVDFDAIQADSIRIEDGQTILTLPPAQFVDGFLDVTDVGLAEEAREKLAGHIGFTLMMEAQRSGQGQMLEQACDGSLFYEANEEAAKVLQTFVDSVEVSESTCELN